MHVPSSTQAQSGRKLAVSAAGLTSVPADDPGDDPTVSAGAVVENRTGKVARRIDVTFTFEDDSGTVVGEELLSDLSWLGPGDRAFVDANPLVDGTPTEVTVEARADELEPVAEFEQGLTLAANGRAVSATEHSIDDLGLAFSDLRYHDALPGSLSASSIVGTVSSSAGLELSGVDVACAALEDGVVVAAGSDSIGSIPAGAAAGLQARGLVSGLQPDEVACSGSVNVDSPWGAAGETYWVSEVARDPELESEVLTATPAEPSERLEVTSGVTPGDDVYGGAVVRNPTDNVADGLYLDLDYLDAAGRVVGHGTSNDYAYLAPGSQTYLAPPLAQSQELDGAVASVAARVYPSSFVVPDDFARAQREMGGKPWSPEKYPFEVTDARYEDGELKGSVVNGGKRALEAVRVFCGLFSGGSIVAAGASTLDEPAPPGAPVEFEFFLGQDGPVDETRCAAGLSEGSLL